MSTARFLTGVVGIAVLLAASDGLRAETLGEGWTYRRTLTVKPVASDAPGENLAWAEFYTNGTVKEGGDDVRVTTAAGVLVPRKIMQGGRGAEGDDLMRIAFATRGEGPYYVWWGNPKATKPDNDVEIKRGVCAQVFRSAGGAVRNVEGLDELFNRSKPPVGALFVPNIYLGYNPLGEERGALVHYSAQFKIEPPITADFAFTVVDAGSVSIDEKVIATDFRSGFQGRVRNPKSVALAAGWHTIDVLQANLGSGNTGVSLVWRRPGERSFSPLPLSILAPVAQATAGPLEKVGSGPTLDFSVEPVAEAFVPPESFVPRYVFEATVPASAAGTVSWDFGDGQSASGEKKVNHYFLTPGTYPVKLTLKQGLAGGQVTSTTRRVAVQERLYALFPKPQQDSATTLQVVLRDYDLQKLSGTQAMRGMLFFKDQSNDDLALAWGKAWLEKNDSPPDPFVLEEAFDLGRLWEKRKAYAQAAEGYHLASQKPIGMETRLNLALLEVMERCEELDDAAAGLKVAKEWEGKINQGSPLQVRTAKSAVIFAAVAAGDTALAEKSAASIGQGSAKSYSDAQIQQGVLARNIESYIRTNDYDTAAKLIDQWEVEYPDAIWVGFTRTLRVKLLAAEGLPLIAARTAVQHARANPGGFYAAELLYRAAENFKAGGAADQAKAAMDLLSSKYPESPYARGEDHP